MNLYHVELTPNALKDLEAIYLFIAEQSGFPNRALGFIEQLKDHCFTLKSNPERDRLREDLRPNTRLIAFERKTIVAYEIHEDRRTVTILNIFYDGRDIDTLLRD